MAERFSGHPQARVNPAAYLAVALLWVIGGLQGIPELWALELPILSAGRLAKGSQPSQPGKGFHQHKRLEGRNGKSMEIHRYMLQICRFMAIGRAWTRAVTCSKKPDQSWTQKTDKRAPFYTVMSETTCQERAGASCGIYCMFSWHIAPCLVLQSILDHCCNCCKCCT